MSPPDEVFSDLANEDIGKPDRFEVREPAGRRLPNDTLGILAQVERMCESWRLWVGLPTPDPEQPKGKPRPRRWTTSRPGAAGW
jgi:hypothetical protein